MFFPATRVRLAVFSRGAHSVVRGATVRGPAVAMRAATTSVRVPSRSMTSRTLPDSLDSPPQKKRLGRPPGSKTRSSKAKKGSAGKKGGAKNAKAAKTSGKSKKRETTSKRHFVVARSMRPPPRMAPRALSLYLQEKLIHIGPPKTAEEAREKLKEVAAQYNKEPEQVKHTYNAAARKIGEERMAAWKIWAVRPDARKIFDHLNQSRVRRGLRAQRRPLDLRRKLPPNAYTMFVSEFARGRPHKQGIIDAASHWRTLSDAEKGRWRAQAEVAREKFRLERLLEKQAQEQAAADAGAGAGTGA
ncbi:hypothetical protein HDZ31DRAFT_76256 [Schizophyllum fasciatum]